MRALAARGHQISLVARPGSEFSELAGQRPALEVTPRRLAPLRGAARLSRLARGADIIHIHRSADLPLAALAKWLAHGHPALVYTRHMAITRDRNRSPVHRLLHRGVDRLLPITEQVAAEARERLPIPPDRILVVRPGVAPATPRHDCDAIRPSGVAFVAGCFSRVEPAKGQHELIASLAGLVRRGINAGAVIAGPVMNPRYAESLRRAVREQHLGKRVRFLGTLPDARASMACCDVIVMPSVNETLGLVLIEAMQMGVPVIGTNAGGVREIIANGETGLTYPPGNEAELTRCLARLATDPQLAAGLGRAGQAFAQEHYDPDRHLDRLEKILSSAKAAISPV